MEQLLPYTETVGSMLVTMQGMESGEDGAKKYSFRKNLRHFHFVMSVQLKVTN